MAIFLDQPGGSVKFPPPQSLQPSEGQARAVEIGKRFWDVESWASLGAGPTGLRLAERPLSQ